MKHSLLQEKYPVFTLEVDKQETSFDAVDPILDYLRSRIDEHKSARFIAIFDHYAHTKALPEGQVAEDIIDARNIVFCFGITLPNPQVMAVRPRSIGVVELADSFVITFMEAPMPVANAAMERWAKSLINKLEENADEDRSHQPEPAHHHRPCRQDRPLSGLSAAAGQPGDPTTGSD